MLPFPHPSHGISGTPPDSRLSGSPFVILYNLGDAIDSVAHTFGELLPQARDQSRNSTLLGLLILGEGWHANHHRVPWSARHGIGPRQFDWTWQVIRLLRAIGFAQNVRVATPADLADRS